MKAHFAAAAMATLALSACATPEDRIETRLVEAGMSPRNAACLAKELTDRLTVSQLRTLGQVAKDVQNTQRVRKMTVGELVEQAGRVGDPKMIMEVSRAALGCTILRG